RVSVAIFRPFELMHAELGHDDHARRCELVTFAVEARDAPAAAEPEELRNAAMAMRPNLPRVQAAAFDQRLAVQEGGRRPLRSVAIEVDGVYGGGVAFHGAEVRQSEILRNVPFFFVFVPSTRL